MPWRVPSFRPGNKKRAPDKRPSSSARGYGSSAWQKLRQQVIARDGSVCRACGLVALRPHVDHIVAKEVHEAAECTPAEGLQVLCGPCHAKKTARETR
jgi:5-methylcytosine-specific restriction endonuclease McrA